MSPTEEASTARPVVYSAAETQADHRLKSGFVPLITGVVIVAAAAVTAAVVFGGGGATPSAPPTSGGLSGGTAQRSASDSLAGAARPFQASGSRSPKQSSAPSAPDSAGPLTVGSIPLTLAPGWQLGEGSDGNYMWAYTPDGKVAFSVEDFAALPENSAGDVLAWWSPRFMNGLDGGNTETPRDLGLTGQRFQESIAQPYTGTRITEDGKKHAEAGSLMVLLNADTGDAALARVWTFSQATTLNAADADVQSMLRSMLN